MFSQKFQRKIRRLDLSSMERRATILTDGCFENGWLSELESYAWETVREEQDAKIQDFGANEYEKRAQLFYREFDEVKSELEEIVAQRIPPLTPWDIQEKLRRSADLDGEILRMRFQPTGDCVGNGCSRAAETVTLDMRAQKFEIHPRPVHPSFSYAGARSLAGSRRGAGANVSLAGKFMFEHGILFEDMPGVVSYDKDRQMSDRLGSRWDSAEFKELANLAAPFRATIVRLPSYSNMRAIDLCLDAGGKIVGGFRRKFVADSTSRGVKFGRLSGTWNHCVPILGRFRDPLPGYIWGNSHGNRYPGPCVLGTPAWALNLSPEDTAAMCQGADLFAILFLQVADNKSRPDWRPLPIL